MDYDALLSQVINLLQREKRVPYRTLKRRFDIDDDYIEDLKIDLIEAKHLAVDENDRILVWTGETDITPTVSPTPSIFQLEATTPTTTEPERAPVSYTPAYLAEKILTTKTSLEGERKVVTVLFADIKDSTELIRDLDPEDAQKLLDPAIHVMMKAVHRFEGTVNQVLGDGIMSIFGAPIAHEDHAARACYAALAMQSVMRDYTDEVRSAHGIEMQIRVGLNSGEVVVRTIGNDLHMDYSAVGPTTHLAARMEQLARPGSIRLSAATLRLVEGLVQVNDLGPIPIKGMDEPVEVFELTGASSIRRRLQAAVARGLTKFVGRDTEMDALNQALERAGSGHGQIVAAVGEAGVGKSRLVYEFVHSHRTQGWLVLESASVSYGKATPYFPVIDLLKRYVHIEDGDDARTIRAKVTGHVLTLDESLQDTIPALLSLLDALPEDSSFLQLDPPQRRQRTLDGLKRILLRESQVQPLVLVFEDLHWHDNESQALLNSLVESLPTAQLLLLVNYRPEYSHHWGDKTYYTQLRLDPLPPESADAFLEALLGNDASLEPLKKLLIERTEGNPFFLEESVRTLVETQVLAGEPGAYRLTQDLPSIQVPPTVQAILAARIDRLPPDEKSLLQTASVIGNEVPLTLLQAIAEMSNEALHPCLMHLQSAEFLYETSLFPERVYTFKHALTHEVAYGSLLQERRRVLHAHIVEEMERLAGDQLAEQVERLAHHAFRGEAWDKALVYFRQAGFKAMERSAYREAMAYFEPALRVLQHLPESRATLEYGIDLRLNIRYALFPLGELEPILGFLQEAETLAERLGTPRRLCEVASGLCHHLVMLGVPDRARYYGERALTIAQAHSDMAGKDAAYRQLGVAYLSIGDYQRTIDFLRPIVAASERETLFSLYSSHALAAISPRVWSIWALTEIGIFAEGMAYGQEALRIGEASDDPYSILNACFGIGYLYLHKGELSPAISILEKGVELCDIWDIQIPFPLVASQLGAAYTLAGRLDNAIPLLELAIARATSFHVPWYQARRLVWLSEALLLAGRTEEATAIAERAIDFAHTHKECGNEAHALRLQGDITMHRNPLDIKQAETHYQQALALANELGMRPLQAHCHRGLGKLYRQTGQAEPARAELTTAIEMYRDMEMTFWIPETEAALAAVEGQ